MFNNLIESGRKSNKKGAFGLGFVSLVGHSVIVLAAVVWASSPFLRERVTTVYENVLTYQPNAMSTPGGERLDFWRNSLVFIADAPVLGQEATGEAPSGRTRTGLDRERRLLGHVPAAAAVHFGSRNMDVLPEKIEMTKPIARTIR